MTSAPALLAASLLITALLGRGSGAGVSSPDSRGRPDSTLSAELARVAGELGISRLAEAGRASLALIDLTVSGSPVSAGIAADSTLGAASVAKLAILLGAFAAREAGRLELTPDLLPVLERMIRASSNDDATLAIERVGFPAIAATLEDPRHALHDSVRGGLWVGSDYTRRQVWRREARSQQAHAASAAAVARFYLLLDRNQLVSPSASAAMREILEVTILDTKFVSGLRSAAGVAAPLPGEPVQVPGYRILRKSGSWGPWQGDSALIESAGRRYILVCLLQDREGGERRLRRLAVAVDQLIQRRHPAVKE